MALFTPEELAELAAADAEIDDNFQLTTEEIARSRAMDKAAAAEAMSAQKALNVRRCKDYYDAHRSERLAYAHAYYQANRDKVSRYKREYYIANRERILENQRARRSKAGMVRKQRSREEDQHGA